MTPQTILCGATDFIGHNQDITFATRGPRSVNVNSAVGQFSGARPARAAAARRRCARPSPRSAPSSSSRWAALARRTCSTCSTQSQATVCRARRRMRGSTSPVTRVRRRSGVCSRRPASHKADVVASQPPESEQRCSPGTRTRPQSHVRGAMARSEAASLALEAPQA